MFSGSSQNVVDGINFLFSNLTGSLVKINSCSFENSVGESSTNTFDLSKSEHRLDVSLYVGVLDSKNVSILFVINDLEGCLQ